VVDFVNYLLSKAPGTIADLDNEVRISHSSGKVSVLWKNRGIPVPSDLDQLKDFYSSYLGASLFSSVFKICSISDNLKRGDVKVVFSIATLQQVILDERVRFPSDSIPFMTQAGIGYYALGPDGTIHEWDTEEAALTGRFDGLCQIVDEWAMAIEQP